MQYPHSQVADPAENLGLSSAAPYRWEPPAQIATSGGQTTAPIDFLMPGSRQHAFVLDYLLRRLRWSENRMSQFYPRWQASELKMQAYTTLPAYETFLRDVRDTGQVKMPNEIVVPYAWATTQTIVTYLLHTFAGRKPIHQVGAYRGEQIRRAKNMETLLQYNADYQKYVANLYQFFNNGEIYGVAVQRNAWRREERMKTVMQAPSLQMQYFMSQLGQTAQPVRAQKKAVCFEGNSVAIISPFMFFPDPRVPMTEVALRGEFVFWRAFEGRHQLMREEAAGRLKWVKYADRVPRSSMGNTSMAGLRALGDSLTDTGSSLIGGEGVTNSYQVDQGSVEIIPAELGLGQSRVPEKWLFTILNQSQIVQAEPQNLNHGLHPLSVSEPNAFGHSFGQLGTVDLLGPMQDLMSWLINSHMYNVRATLNNFLVVDPTKVEIDDFLDPQPGGLIRLKNTPWGVSKPSDAVHQLQIGDVTRAHLADFQLVNRMGNDLTGASDNIRGNQDPGGRKTATEVRTSFEAGGSRLASRAMIYSVTGIVPSAEQWASNYQQLLSGEFEMRVLGQDGQMNSVRISPEEIEGDFFFPIHDGTLPLDRGAMLQQWKEIWLAMVQDPTGRLPQTYDTGAIFNFMAKLGGAQNIDQFKMTAGSQQGIDQQVQAGNMVPLSQLAHAMPGGPAMPMIAPGAGSAQLPQAA